MTRVYSARWPEADMSASIHSPSKPKHGFAEDTAWSAHISGRDDTFPPDADEANAQSSSKTSDETIHPPYTPDRESERRTARSTHFEVSTSSTDPSQSPAPSHGHDCGADGTGFC